MASLARGRHSQESDIEEPTVAQTVEEEQEILPDNTDYILPVDTSNILHMVAGLALVAVPLSMIGGAFLKQGLHMFLNWRVLLVVPIIAALYGFFIWTKGLGKVSVADIEEAYPNFVVIEGEDDAPEPRRPSSISVRTKDGSTAPITVVLLGDWENGRTKIRLHGIIVVKDTKAAVLLSDRGFSQFDDDAG